MSTLLRQLLPSSNFDMRRVFHYQRVLRNLLLGIFIMTRCAFGELRRCVRLFFRAPQASAYNDTKRYREYTRADEEESVPTVRKSQKREHRDKSAGEHYECVDGHTGTVYRQR